jgi:hypothetical protein
MSPNRFSVTMTSKSAGRRISSMAHESTSWWLRRTSGYSTAISSVTRRQSREVASTFALSTWVTAPRRVRASSKARRTIRLISRSAYGSVSSAVRAPGSPDGSVRSPK